MATFGWDKGRRDSVPTCLKREEVLEPSSASQRRASSAPSRWVRSFEVRVVVHCSFQQLGWTLRKPVLASKRCTASSACPGPCQKLIVLLGSTMSEDHIKELL